MKTSRLVLVVYLYLLYLLQFNRLDAFFMDAIGDEPILSNIWRVMKLFVILSHGLATVESGFSVNKEVNRKAFYLLFEILLS